MSRSVTVLHVEDDQGFAELTAEYLETNADGLEVVTERDAAAALDRLTGSLPDCIVSDYQMPGMDGLELLAAVREEYPDLPFVLFTGEGSEEVASDAIAGGATDYLQKEAGTEQFELLTNRIRNAVDQYRASRRAEELERVRALLRSVNQSLVRAQSREAIETAVCETLAGADPYLFAWIGAASDDETVEPRTSAGIEAGYLDDIRITVEERPAGEGPVGTAIRDRELSFTQNVHQDPAFERWREEATERGYQAVAGVPLEYGDELYGVLGVYADRPDAFDDRERRLLDELGDDIAHALHARQTREELERTAARLEALFEDSPDMIDVHDASGVILDANPRLCEKLGYDSDELVGKRIWEIDERADAERAAEQWESLAAGERLEVEGRLRRRDGTTFPAEVHVRRLDVGDGDRFIVSSRDVTDRKERERELEWFRIVTDEVTHNVTVVAADGTITYANPAVERTLGYPPDEIVGDDAFEYMHPDDRAGVKEAFTGLVEKSDPTVDRMVFRMQDADGTWRWMESEASNRTDPALDGYVITSRDITDRKEHERELRRQKERLDEFATVVSHDLKTPLTTAQLSLDIGRDDGDPEAFDRVERSLDRMRHIVDDVLWLAREGQQIGRTEPVTLRAVLEDAWSVVATPDREGSLVVPETDLGTVEADRKRLVQLLENLLQNAFAHAGEDVTIRFEPTPTGFAVEDDGPGIPADDRDRVLDRGYSTAEDGTGFGLAIVDEIVAAHGWDVTVTEGADGGARFEISGASPR